jgi:FG-GAP repeat
MRPPGAAAGVSRMRRASIVIAVALAMAVTAAWPVIGAVAQPSPTDRTDRVDFNGDGFDDLAVGAAGEDVGAATDAGAVNVQYGSSAGLPGAGGQLFTQDSPGVGGTAESGDGFGSALD